MVKIQVFRQATADEIERGKRRTKLFLRCLIVVGSVACVLFAFSPNAHGFVPVLLGALPLLPVGDVFFNKGKITAWALEKLSPVIQFAARAVFKVLVVGTAPLVIAIKEFIPEPVKQSLTLPTGVIYWMEVIEAWFPLEYMLYCIVAYFYFVAFYNVLKLVIKVLTPTMG